MDKKFETPTWSDAISAVTKLKAEVDKEVSAMVEANQDPEIMLQLGQCCTEMLQCTEAIQKGIMTWDRIPLSQASV